MESMDGCFVVGLYVVSFAMVVALRFEEVVSVKFAAFGVLWRFVVWRFVAFCGFLWLFVAFWRFA